MKPSVKRIAIAVAIGPDRVIGADNHMPWQLPRDLRFFRRLTTGHTVVMGRKTFESLRRKALPNRLNVVISRNKTYTAKGCTVVHSLEEALSLPTERERIFVIGGGSIYEQAIPFAHEIFITKISKDKSPVQPLFPAFLGEVFFPDVDGLFWHEVRHSRNFLASSSMKPPHSSDWRGPLLTFSFHLYRRVDCIFPLDRKVSGLYLTQRSVAHANRLEQVVPLKQSTLW